MDLLDHHRASRPGDDDWREGLNDYRAPFEAYRRLYLGEGDYYINVDHLLSKLEELNKLPADASSRQAAARMLSKANVAMLVCAFTTSASSSQSGYNELQALDHDMGVIIPMGLLSDDGRQSLFKQALATRTQLAIAAIAQLANADLTPARCVVMVFSSVTGASNVAESQAALETGPYRDVGGLDPEDDASKTWQHQCQERITFLLSKLAGKTINAGIGTLRQTFPYEGYCQQLKVWALEQLASVDARPRSESPPFFDVPEGVDGISQADSQNDSELASQPIVRTSGAAPR